MRHFAHLSEFDLSRLFHLAPEPITCDSDRETLAVALGATLYMPATRPALAADIAKQAGLGVVSVVACLEDAIADDDVPAAQANVIAQLRLLGQAGSAVALPLVFVRVRHPDQVAAITNGLGENIAVLRGFVVPKFSDVNGASYLTAVVEASAAHDRHLYVMPVLESPEIAYAETRAAQLAGAHRLLSRFREHVLAVRIGATDLCGAYGIRRDRDLTIYDVRVVADAITDIVNTFGRARRDGFVVTGPVWEYFPNHDRIFKPQLRESPFTDNAVRPLRQQLLLADLDGLIREILLDKANGLTGKTVIHPTHVAAVHAMSVVSHEEYSDALDILGADLAGGGVARSGYRNKMNEAKPHRAWAERTVRRAHVFGVAAEGITFIDLLATSVESILAQEAA